MKISILLTTVNSKSTAVRLARAALDAKAAACVQILPPMESHYVWKGKQEKSREFLVLAKTSTRKTLTLERLWSPISPILSPAPTRSGHPEPILACGSPRFRVIRWRLLLPIIRSLFHRLLETTAPEPSPCPKNPSPPQWKI